VLAGDTRLPTGRDRNARARLEIDGLEGEIVVGGDIALS
jgi:hypothetical protein